MRRVGVGEVAAARSVGGRVEQEPGALTAAAADGPDGAARASTAAVVEEVRAILARARQACRALASAPAALRDRGLQAMAAELRRQAQAIRTANEADVEAARRAGLRAALVDRLYLDSARLERVAAGLEGLSRLEDPLGQARASWRRPNGLEITAVRVPLGVVAVIYEARPDVTADAAGLCIKSGNAVVLRGGSEALRTNQAVAAALQEGLRAAGLPEHGVQLVARPEREAAVALMQATGLVDLLIPRGGPGLIRTVVEQARVPVIETGVGNCHIYLDESAPYEMAERIVLNAKVQRPSVCNAVETLLVHEGFAHRHLRELARALQSHGVELRGCPTTCQLVPTARPAREEDWATEYLDLILAVRVVRNLEEAVDHIARYGTGHSEAIVTRDWEHARRFTREVDAAAVYVNASTRFTDGFEFGFGAEIGISTQKLHARGPMGLEALTTIKYVVAGDGQVRA